MSTSPETHFSSAQLTGALLRLQDKSSTFAGPMDVVKTVIKNDGLLGMSFEYTR